MATKCTEDAVLEFLIEKGGRVKNKELIDHFKVFFTSETTKTTVCSEFFRNLIDNIAYIKQENEENFVCLKKKYRDQGKRSVKTEDCKTPVAENSGSPHSNSDTLNGANDQNNGLYNSEFTENGVERGSFNYIQGVPSVGVENILGSNEKNECSKKSKIPSTHRIPETVSNDKRMCVSISEIKSELCMTDIALIEATSSDYNYNFSHDANLKDIDIANVPKKEKKEGDGEYVETEDMFPSARSGKLDLVGSEADHASRSTLTAQLAVRRRGSSRNPMSNVSEADPALDTDNSAPRCGRRSLAERIVGESPQVRRSLVRRSSHGWATAGRQDSVKSDGDSASEDSAFITLDPLEHEWMMCASDGEWENLQRLLACEPNLITKKDFVTGFTCLHWAAKQGKHDLIVMLITFAQQHGVAIDVNARSGAGYTPLHLAAMHSHVEVMKLLAEGFGANQEARDYSGRKPCQYLSTTVSGDIRDIIRVHEHEDAEDVESGSGHWRLSKVFQSNLNPLRMLVLPEEGDGVGGARPRPLYRKSSIGKIKLKGGRSKAQIVHSTSFRETEEASDTLKSPVKSRPVSNLFG
ncbi:uncharacterized protein sowahca [Brachyhypopomus gauderio]|uniref:uncharacterized protein sowahca n=1 Tax=Brachyhypopomus gauderio TaxID=698409 RepID=UPI004042EC01